MRCSLGIFWTTAVENWQWGKSFLKILPQRCWPVLNHYWFFSPSLIALTVPIRQRFRVSFNSSEFVLITVDSVDQDEGKTEASFFFCIKVSNDCPKHSLWTPKKSEISQGRAPSPLLLSAFLYLNFPLLIKIWAFNVFSLTKFQISSAIFFKTIGSSLFQDYPMILVPIIVSVTFLLLWENTMTKVICRIKCSLGLMITEV